MTQQHQQRETAVLHFDSLRHGGAHTTRIVFHCFLQEARTLNCNDRMDGRSAPAPPGHQIRLGQETHALSQAAGYHALRRPAGRQAEESWLQPHCLIVMSWFMGGQNFPKPCLLVSTLSSTCLVHAWDVNHSVGVVRHSISRLSFKCNFLSVSQSFARELPGLLLF